MAARRPSSLDTPGKTERMSAILLPGGNIIDSDSFDEGDATGSTTGVDFIESPDPDARNSLSIGLANWSFHFGWGCDFLAGYPNPNFSGSMIFETLFELLLKQGISGGVPTSSPPPPPTPPANPFVSGIPYISNNILADRPELIATDGYFFNHGQNGASMQYLDLIMPGRYQLSNSGTPYMTADTISVFATVPAGAQSPSAKILLYTVNNQGFSWAGSYPVNGQSETFDSVAAFGQQPFSIRYEANHLGTNLTTFFSTGIFVPSSSGGSVVVTPGLSPLQCAYDESGNFNNLAPFYFLTDFPNQNPPGNQIPALDLSISGTPI